MLGMTRAKDVSSPAFVRLKRAGLVPLHEPAVAGHIGGKDGSEAAFHAGASLGVSLAQRHARRSSGSRRHYGCSCPARFRKLSKARAGRIAARRCNSLATQFGSYTITLPWVFPPR